MAGKDPEPYCTMCGHYPYAADSATPLCSCGCHQEAARLPSTSPKTIDVAELRTALNELEHLRSFRTGLQKENSRVTEENRKMKAQVTALKDLALQFLGQHLWQAKLQSKGTTACLCSVCDAARQAYELLTGAWPTTEEEEAAVHKFAKSAFRARFHE